jgi:hypothetical protein
LWFGSGFDHLAIKDTVSASTQNQALAGILLLYSEVLGQKLDTFGSFIHAKKPERLPVVMTRLECEKDKSANFPQALAPVDRPPPLLTSRV